MTARQRTYCILGMGAALATAAGVLAWRNGAGWDTATLLQRLPTQDAVVAGLDFDALRRAGILESIAGRGGLQDAEYVDFVRDTGFDYQRDLHYVVASFAPDGEFFLIRGAFDWDKLERYARLQKGSCVEGLCRVNGSTPEKKISYYRLRRDVMALAVARDDAAARRLDKPGPQDDVPASTAPVWLTLSAGALRHSASLPGASRLFASAIMDAERVTITAGPASGGGLEARLEAVCRDAQQAGALSEQLQALTGLLTRAGTRDGQKMEPDELGGVLASGKFWNSGSQVVGRWRIPQGLIRKLVGSS